MKFWIVRYSHRHGDDCWPIWTDEEPTIKWLLKSDPDFASNYEGEESGKDEWREDEYVEFYGPFYTP